MGTHVIETTEHIARATISSVVVTGLSTYRRSFWRIVVAAILVFAPIDLAVTLATEAATAYAERSDVLSVFLWTSGTALGVAGTILSLVFFAGVIDRIVAVDQKGEEDLPLHEILRGLPTLRLVLASVVAAALTVLGLLLFLVPGFALMVLFAIVGPVIVIESRGVWSGLARSAGLTSRHGILVVVTVLIPTTLDEQLSSWLERFAWYEHPWIHLPLDVGSTIIVGGLVGVLEVTLAHALIADQRRRRVRGEATAAVTEATAGADAATPRVAAGKAAASETVAAAPQAADR
jgi:hypothetical protein